VTGQAAQRAGGRVPPHDLAAEAHLLGAAMLQPAALAVVAGVAVEDFYKPAHAHIATVLQALGERGEPADPVTVGHELDRAGIFDVVGGHQALIDLMSNTPATSNAAHHAAIIREHAVARRLLGLAGEIADLAYTTPDGATAATQHALALVEDLANHARTNPGPGGGLTLTPAAAITVDRPAWAWEQRIPLAGVTLIPGREGEGKTALVGHICARLTQGDLPGDRWGRPGHVIYIGHEDDRATVLVPRLIAAGADLDRFWFVDLPHGAPFTVSVDINNLARQARGRDIAAIVLDPLDAHLGVQDSHKKADVQAAITRLAALTQQLRAAGIGIAHLNKGDHRDVLLKVVGSVGLTTAVRSVLAVGPHPHQPDEKVAVLRKANMTDRSAVPAIRFRVEGTTIAHPNDPNPITTARVVLLGEDNDINADDILTAGEADQRGALDKAVAWLDGVLADGPLLKADVVTLARHDDISERTLERAAERLGVTVHRDHTQRGRPSWWGHPNSTADYPPAITRQDPLAGNSDASDQAQHAADEGHPPHPGNGGKPPTNGQHGDPPTP
jgi:DnaB helicase-like protein/AAA domain-containing protein